MKNQRIYLIVFILVVLIGSVYLLLNKNNQPAIPTVKSPVLNTISLAFDWTPNTNHTGIYVALAKGWYKEAGIDLNILPYSAAVTPDVLVSTGKADLGISFTEGVVADYGSGSPVVSIAAILSHNTSGLIVRKDSKIIKPAQLENKIYGGFGAPFESAVVSNIIKHDGGTGKFKNVTLDVDAMQALKDKKIDFVWGYTGWEVIQAKSEGLEVNFFPITQYGIPDYSTPNIITSGQVIKTKADLLKKFIIATAKGYEFARTNSTESAKILIDSAPLGTFSNPDFVYESQQYLSDHYADSGKPWGIQNPDSWHNYPQFMLDNQAVLDTNGKPLNHIDFDSLYTNQFFN